MAHSWHDEDIMLDKLVEDRLAEDMIAQDRQDMIAQDRIAEDRLQEDSEMDRLEQDRGMDRLIDDRGIERLIENSAIGVLGENSEMERLKDNSEINQVDKNCDLDRFRNYGGEDNRMELLEFQINSQEEMEAFNDGEENLEEEDPEPLQRSRCNTWPTLRRNAPVTSSSDEHESVSTNSPTGSLRGGVIVQALSPPSHLPHPLGATPPTHPHLLQLQRSPSGSNSGATLALVSEEGFSEGEDSHCDIPDGSGCVGGLGGISKYKAQSMSSRRNPWGNYSYADLITQAIQSSPDCRLTLSQVYDWMISNIPYFKDKGDTNSSAGWKNSIRHNLSLHQKFVRVQNEGAGKSSWWTINPEAKVGPKPPRRRALSMETSRLEKQRARAKKRADCRLERASSSISVSTDLFPASPQSYFQQSPDFSRHRTSSNASSCGRISPTHFRSRTLSNASSVGCSHNSPPSLVDQEGNNNIPDIKLERLERDVDLDNIHLDNLNIDLFQEIAVKEEVASNDDIGEDCQDQVHKVKILERREPNMMNFFGQQMAPAKDLMQQDNLHERMQQDHLQDRMQQDHLHERMQQDHLQDRMQQEHLQDRMQQDHLQQDYAARRQEMSQDQMLQDYAAMRQEIGHDQMQQDYAVRGQDMAQDQIQRQQDLRRREIIRQQQARRPTSVVKLVEDERMARIQQQATTIEEVARMEEIARMEEAERIEKIKFFSDNPLPSKSEKIKQEKESIKSEGEAARDEKATEREIELLDTQNSEDSPERLPGEMSRQGVIFMKRERYRKKLMEVTLNQLKEKRVKIQRDNSNISYSNKQSLLVSCDTKIKLLVEQLAKYEHLDDNRLLNMDTQRELERIGGSVLITEPMLSMSGGLFFGENDSFMDTMDQDMDNHGLEFSFDFKPLEIPVIREETPEIAASDLVQQVIEHELKMEGNLDFTRSELIMYEMREPPGVPWI